MQFYEVNETNIALLYHLNKQLAIDENQASLFTASLEDYREPFLKNNPSTFGLLLYHEKQPIGFVIYMDKFATYLGKSVMFIEDIYVKKELSNNKNLRSIFDHLLYIAKQRGDIRLEMRVLKDYSIDTELLASYGFNPVEKWDVYRKELA